MRNTFDGQKRVDGANEGGGLMGKHWTGDHVVKRALLLYGAYTLLNNVVFLLSYYLLPQGALRDTPLTAAGRIAMAPEGFLGGLALTLLFNVGIVSVFLIGANLFEVDGFPLGYLVVLVWGVFSGLILGTDSFAVAGSMQMPLREGLAAGLLIGGLETIGYICVVASTARLGIFHDERWWSLKTSKVRRFRDVHLNRAEIAVLSIGLVAIVVAALNETLDFLSVV